MNKTLQFVSGIKFGLHMHTLISLQLYSMHTMSEELFRTGRFMMNQFHFRYVYAKGIFVVRNHDAPSWEFVTRRGAASLTHVSSASLGLCRVHAQAVLDEPRASMPSLELLASEKKKLAGALKRAGADDVATAAQSGTVFRSVLRGICTVGGCGIVWVRDFLNRTFLQSKSAAKTSFRQRRSSVSVHTGTQSW